MNSLSQKLDKTIYILFKPFSEALYNYYKRQLALNNSRIIELSPDSREFFKSKIKAIETLEEKYAN